MEQFGTGTNYRRMTKHSNVRAQLTENPVSFRYNHMIEISVKTHLSLNSYSDCHGRKKKSNSILLSLGIGLYIMCLLYVKGFTKTRHLNLLCFCPADYNSSKRV